MADKPPLPFTSATGALMMQRKRARSEAAEWSDMAAFKAWKAEKAAAETSSVSKTASRSVAQTMTPRYALDIPAVVPSKPAQMPRVPVRKGGVRKDPSTLAPEYRGPCCGGIKAWGEKPSDGPGCKADGFGETRFWFCYACNQLLQQPKEKAA